MTLQASGVSASMTYELSMQASGPISMGNYYRGGTAVRGNASNNNATNLSANVPTSGAIALDDFIVRNVHGNIPIN